MTPFEKELLWEDEKQYVYSEINENQEPVMSLKLSAA